MLVTWRQKQRMRLQGYDDWWTTNMNCGKTTRTCCGAGYRLNIIPAPAPADIRWENLGGSCTVTQP